MPSGAKKRKAAKKKKVQQNNPNSSAQSHGNVDVQHYNENQSGNGSSVSQYHHKSEHSFAQGDGFEIEKSGGSKSGQSVGLEKSSIVGGVSSGENVAIEKGSNESKEVHTGGSSVNSSSSCSSNSSRSSSDDESYVEKKREVVETRVAVDSVEPVNSLFEVASQVDSNIPDGGNSKSTADTAFVVDPDKVSLVEKVAQVNGGSSSDYSVISSVDYKLGVRGDADMGLLSYDNSSGITSSVMDSGSSKKEDNMVLTSEEKLAVDMDVKNSATAGKDEVLLAHNSPNVHISNVADHLKGSESPGCSNNQHLGVSAPQVVKKTSFKSCCGIFELFNSSDR